MRVYWHYLTWGNRMIYFTPLVSQALNAWIDNLAKVLEEGGLSEMTARQRAVICGDANSRCASFNAGTG